MPGPKLRAAMLSMLAATVVLPAHAAVVSVRHQILPRQSDGVFDRAFPDGDDATPIHWGTIPNLQIFVGDSCDFNLRTLGGLLGTNAATATLSKLSGTLPTGCSLSTDGLSGTASASSMGQVYQWRATDGADTADSNTFTLAVLELPSGDTSKPTSPVNCHSTPGQNAITVDCDPATDPYVGEPGSGIVGYRIYFNNSLAASHSSPTANSQPSLLPFTVGDASGTQSATRTGPDLVLSSAGAGLSSTTDQFYAVGHQTVGDTLVSAKFTGFSASAANTAGWAFRASGDANAVYASCRFRDSDDKVNNRYRTSTGGAAGNGVFTDAIATPLWLRALITADAVQCFTSTNGNDFSATEPPRAISLGATTYSMLLHASGDADTDGAGPDTATTTTAAFEDVNITTAARWSATFSATAAGSCRVSAIDGEGNESDLGPAFDCAPIVIEEPPASTVNVPNITAPNLKTVCQAGPPTCDYGVADLQGAAISTRTAGQMLELRTASAGGSEVWSAPAGTNRLIYCNGVSGTSGSPIWVVVRDGDSITLDGAIGGTGNGLIKGTNCSYWNFVGSRDGGVTGIQFGNLARHTAPCVHFTGSRCYPYEHAIYWTGGTGLALVGFTMTGAGSYGGSLIDKTSSKVLFRHFKIDGAGSNAFDANADGTIAINASSDKPDGDTDSSELMKLCATNVVMEDGTIAHGGHKSVHMCGPYQVMRRVANDGNWMDRTNYPQYTGNHAMTIQNQLSVNEWNLTTMFGPLVEDSLIYGVGSEPEHKEFNETTQLQGFNIIFRRNYIVQRYGLGFWGKFVPQFGAPGCGSSKSVPSDQPWFQYDALYNNTLWGAFILHSMATAPPTGGGSYCSANPTHCNWSSTAGKTNAQCQADPTNCTATTQMNGFAPGLCANWSIRNNLFQGQQTGRSLGQSAGTSTTINIRKIGVYTGHANSWKSDEWFGNIFGRHPTDPADPNLYKVQLQSGPGGSGGGVQNLNAASDANGDFDCADGGDTAGLWPANWCGNRDVTLTWAGGSTTPLSNAVDDQSINPTTLRGLLTLATTQPTGTCGSSANCGVGDAWPMTTTTDAGSNDTALVMANARWIYDGWDNEDYTWGGLHTEYPDCIAVGPTATSTPAQAVVTGVAADGINYATGAVTVSPGVTHVAGSPVWPAIRNADGSCGAVIDNRGAAQ